MPFISYFGSLRQSAYMQRKQTKQNKLFEELILQQIPFEQSGVPTKKDI